MTLEPSADEPNRGEPGTGDTSGTVALPVIRCDSADDMSPVRAVDRFLRVAVELLPEVVDIRLRACAGGGRAATGYLLVTAADTTRAMGAARNLRLVARATMPFIYFGEPIPSHFEGAAGGSVAGLDSVTVSSERDFGFIAVTPWVAASDCSSRVSIDLAIVSVCSESDEATLRVEVRGDPSDAIVVASLVAVAAGGDTRLVPDHRRTPIITVPLACAARLFLSPFAEVSMWRNRSEVVAPDVDRVFDIDAPGTMLVFGGSQRERSNLLALLARSAVVESDRTIIVLTNDTDLAATCAPMLAGEGRPYDAVFFDADHPAHVNVCDPGLGNGLAHANDLLELIEASLGSGTSTMSPVLRRAYRCTLGVLVLNPAGAEPLTMLEQMWTSGPLPSRWESLYRIAEPTILQELLAVRSAIGADPRLRWELLSWAEQFLGDARVRAVIDRRHSSVRFDHLLRGGRSLLVAAPVSVLGERGSSLLMTYFVMRLLREMSRRDDARPPELIVEFDHFPKFVLSQLLEHASRHHNRLTLASPSPSTLEPEVFSTVMAQASVVAASRLSAIDGTLIDARFPTVAMWRVERLRSGEWAVTSGDRDLISHLGKVMVEPDVDLLRISSQLSAPADPAERNGT